MPERFAIRYALEAVEDIRGLRAFDRARALAKIERHLRLAATQVSRSHIKRRVQPFWSQYRLRADDYRVYDDVDEGTRTVHVLRVLFKGTGQTPEEKP